MSSLGFKLNQEGTEQVFDHDKDGKPIPLYNPLTGKHDIKFTAKKLFYRTPTLVSIWATAPYLHNNSVGIVQRRPVSGRPHGRLRGWHDQTALAENGGWEFVRCWSPPRTANFRTSSQC